jgi:hypothetical protein
LHGFSLSSRLLTFHHYLIRHGSHKKHRAQQLYYCCVCVRCRGNVLTEPLSHNGLLFWLYYSGLHCSLLKTVRPEKPTGVSLFLNYSLLRTARLEQVFRDC